MLIPTPLIPGDHVGLIAPCSPVSQELIPECIDVIKSLEYFPVLGKSVTSNLHGYLAGSDEIRARDINLMFANPNIRAIFCIRGGYGSNRLMKLIDYSIVRAHPKIFIGYSDITSFHLAFNSLCNLITFHGPMVSSNMIHDFDPYTEFSLLTAIKHKSCYQFENPPGYPLLTIVPGLVKGRILGGCLSLVSPSIGTFYQPSFNNNILFLEDVDETIPRIDKMMNHLKNTGVFTQVSGVILGNFKNCVNPQDLSYDIFQYFCDFFKDYDKPVLYGLQSGHAKPMGTIPLGTLCILDTENKIVKFDFW